MTSRRHLLVTNDFPPKIGGIQNYLWELWRRLPSEQTTVMCTPHDGAAAFDARQAFRIERSPEPVLIPYPWLGRRIRALADEVGAELIMLDPAVPLGAIGPSLGRPYGVVLHGAEVTIPGRMPVSSAVLRRVLCGASLVVSAGQYALDEAERCAGRSLPSVVVPPGVDVERFSPPTDQQRVDARRRFGIGDDDIVVATVNRLVPRKGIDRLIQATGRLAERRPDGPTVRLIIGGTGREASRLEALIDELDAPVELLGRIDDDAVVDLYRAADVMAMLCHDRWFGLEQEGFGIVFLEAAAVGIPQVAGRSGGAAEAVADGETGVVVNDPTDIDAIVDALAGLIDDPDRRAAMGAAARRRAVDDYSYDHLAARLDAALTSAVLR